MLFWGFKCYSSYPDPTAVEPGVFRKADTIGGAGPHAEIGADDILGGTEASAVTQELLIDLAPSL